MSEDPPRALLLKVHLLDVSPMVWRRLRVPETTTLAPLPGVVPRLLGSRAGPHCGLRPDCPTVFYALQDLARRAGLPDAVSPHFFRHAHASHALDRGAPPHLVQQTLGHASLQTTSRYAHARPDDSSARYLGV